MTPHSVSRSTRGSSAVTSRDANDGAQVVSWRALAGQTAGRELSGEDRDPFGPVWVVLGFCLPRAVIRRHVSRGTGGVVDLDLQELF